MALLGSYFAPVLSAALLLAFPPPAAAAPAGKVLPDPDGSGAVILRSDGAMEHVDLASGQARGLRAAGDVAHPAAIARPGKGSIVYAIVPSDDGRTTALEAHDTGGEAGPSLAVKGRGHFLEVTEDGRFACIAGTKAGSKDEAPDRWILTVVDIATGEVAPPIPIGFVPTAMALRGRDGILARLFVAGDDRVATYSMVPPRPSWFYRSPGAHHDIALPSASAVVFLLRDGTFAVIDPERWERDEGRVRATADDATAIVELDQPGASIALSPDGRFAAVLATDGLTIALIDVAAARRELTIALDGSQDLLARVMAPPVDDAGAPRLLLASRERGSPPSWIDAPLPARTEPVAIAVVPEPPAPAASAPEEPRPDDAARDMTAPPPQAFPTAAQIESMPPPPDKLTEPAPPPGTAPFEKPAEPASQQSPEKAQPQKQAEPAPPVVSQPEPAPPAATPQPGPAEPTPIQEEPTEPPPPASEPPPAPDRVLSGRVRGAIPEGLQILLYGPDNVLRLGARAPVAPDGQWRLPLPAPGRYRVVVSAGSGRHIFASPEFRTIAITGSGEGMADIDFEIRGSL